MKILISSLIYLSFCTAFAQVPETEITCDFREAGNFANIQRVSLISGDPGFVKVIYTNGDVESFKPLSGVGGLFNQIRFSPVVSNENNSRSFTFLQLDTRHSNIGEFHAAYACNKSFTTFCNGFSGDKTPIARVTLNIDGAVLKFNGSSLPYCERKDI